MLQCFHFPGKLISEISYTFSLFFIFYFFSNHPIFSLGPFGSGKSLIGQNLLQSYLENPDNKGVYYVITWDAYSLMYCELKDVCCALEESKKNDVEVICKSIVDISTEKGSSRLLSLPECLEYLSTLHQGDVNVMIEEFDPEYITDQVAQDVNRLMNSLECYKNAFFTLVLQSIKKKRWTVTSAGLFDHCTSSLDKLDMEIYELPKTMRFTKQIHESVQKSQLTISSEENIYIKPEDLNRSSSVVSSSFDPKISQPPSIVLKKKPEDLNRSGSLVSSSFHMEEPKISQQPSIVLERHFEIHPNTDSMAKICSVEHTLNTDKDSLKTRFEFPGSKGCGHAISDQKPRLIRIPSGLRAFNVKSINTIISLFRKIFPKWRRRCMFLINELELAKLISSAFKALNIEPLEYLHNLRQEHPSSDVKEKVYLEWKNTKNCILLTDNRGSCGLQYDKVGLFSIY